MAKKIMIVDDSLTIRQQVMHCLRNLDFEIVEAVDGENALELIGQHSDTSLIICDLFMPKLDGIGFIEKLRQANNNTAVVMLTTENRASQIEKAKQFGVKAWLIKPFLPQNLITIVQKFVA